MNAGPGQRLAFDFLTAVHRPGKPRRTGLTYVRDAGLSTLGVQELLEAAGDYVDVLKLAAYSPRLQSRELVARKVALCREAGVDVGLGGVILELAVLQGPAAVFQLLDHARELGLTHIEVSRAFVILSAEHLAHLVRTVRDAGFLPIAEVGVAYAVEPDDVVEADVSQLVSTMQRCLEAGAWKVLLESEGLTENRHPADMRWDVVSTVSHAVGLDQLMFEADDRLVWNRYIHDLGPDVNLFVDHSRVLRLEASRLGGWAQPQGVVRRVATFHPDHPEMPHEPPRE